MDLIDFYTSRDSNVKGPFSFDEIEEQIRSSRLSLLDLIYSESFGRWMMLNEVPEFQSAFQNSYRQRGSAKPSQHGEWIILKSFETSSHVLGPFEKNQIFAMLSSGELKYSDSVWKPGDAAWVRIGDRDEFDRRAVANAAPASAETLADSKRMLPVDYKSDPSQIDRIPASEILGNIARLDRTLKPPSQEIPAEAQGEDLTSEFLILNTLKRGVVVVLLSAALLPTTLRADTVLVSKKSAAANQKQKFALFYSSKKMINLTRRLSTADLSLEDNAKSWNEEFEAAQSQVEDAFSTGPQFYSTEIKEFRESAKRLIAEFSSRRKSSAPNRLPASVETAAGSNSNKLLEKFEKVKNAVGHSDAAEDEPI